MYSRLTSTRGSRKITYSDSCLVSHLDALRLQMRLDGSYGPKCQSANFSERPEWMPFSAHALIVLVLVLAGCQMVPSGRAPEPEWQLVMEEDFDSADCLCDWVLDGAADASVTQDGRLRIQTLDRETDAGRVRCSVLWHSVPVWGDLRLEFDAKAAPKSRCIFFFNARGTGKDRSILTWKRPLAAYADYAYDPRIELYTLGILRSDQTALNMRHLGGQVNPEWAEIMPYHPYRFPARFLTEAELARCLNEAGLDALPADWPQLRSIVTKPQFKQALAPHIERRKRVNAEFQAKSIIASSETDSPVFGDPDEFYRIAITVRGAHIVVEVDGRTLMDFVDAGREQAPLRGGYFGFRDFVPTEAEYDNLRVYRLKP